MRHDDSRHAVLSVFERSASACHRAGAGNALRISARTLAGGKREGILSALGTFLGGMAHVFAAAAGISVILAKSASAFATVKYAGAAYLCYLGIRMILDAQKQGAALS